MTVGELRKALEGAPDDMPVSLISFIKSGPDQGYGTLPCVRRAEIRDARALERTMLWTPGTIKEDHFVIGLS